MAQPKPSTILPWTRGDKALAKSDQLASRLGYHHTWSSWKTEHAGPSEMAALAALGLPEKNSRIAVLSALAQTASLDSRPVATIAIDMDNPDILAEVHAILPLDPLEWRFAAEAARSGRTRSLSWLIDHGFALSDSLGASPLSLMAWRRLNDMGEWTHSGQPEAIALLSTPANIEALSPEAKIEALNTMGDNIAYLLNPSSSNERGPEFARASFKAFAALWDAMTPQERAKAPRGVEALFLGKLDLDGHFGIGKDAQKPLVVKQKRSEPNDYQLKALKAWNQCRPTVNELRVLAASVDWALIEDCLQKDGRSLATAVLRWAADAPDRHDRDIHRYSRDDQGGFALDEAFDRVDQAIGAPFRAGAKIFIDESGISERKGQGPSGLKRWMLSEWPGSALCTRLTHAKASVEDELFVGLEEDILARINAYCGDAKALASGKRPIPTVDERKKESRYADPGPLESFVLKGLESELMALFRLAPNDDFAVQINRLCNDWGSTPLTEANCKETMAVWADKLAIVEETLRTSFQTPSSKVQSKLRRI